jgi:hypothetical protein
MAVNLFRRRPNAASKRTFRQTSRSADPSPWRRGPPKTHREAKIGQRAIYRQVYIAAGRSAKRKSGGRRFRVSDRGPPWREREIKHRFLIAEKENLWYGFSFVRLELRHDVWREKAVE